ncbi:acyltransferase [Pseudidiomarina taiwanensis]|uniref:Galactoside O-acetyltransferase n=1 Tax=Pseudidiomarina taiwanensis TaxID=337250 RepID=A0A432ZK99_9GAMM|nr:acyltransferase [Pseudidiomarina taiwanensis]RUO78398.1 galactoside O-acetyltransferase [Pseudidiomarina taiwanensis]
MITIYSVVGRILNAFHRLWSFFIKQYKLSKFQKVGANVWIGQGCHFTEDTIFIGDNVSIGRNCCFQSKHGRILIGNDVMFGPRVHIHGGNHQYKVIGIKLRDYRKDKNHDDGVVNIDSDTWIGAGSIILANVSIGKGAIVGAGSVVTKSVPPYAIVAGNPAKVIKFRFNQEEIREHERIIGYTRL